MKKITKGISALLICLLVMLNLSIPVKAASSYVVELVANKETVKPGDTLEVTIKVKDIVDISNGIAGLSVKVEYNEEKLEKVGNAQALNGFLCIEGDTIELAAYPGVTSETEIAKLTFKVKDGATGDVTVKLTGVEAANGEENFALGKEVVKTIAIETVDAGDEGTGNEGTGNEGTGNEGTGNEGTGNEGTGNEGTGNEGTGNEGTGNEGTGNEGTGNEGTGNEGTGNEGTGNEGTGNEGTGNEGTGNEGTGNNGNNNPKEELPEKIPNAGENLWKVSAIVGIVLAIAVISFMKMKKLSDI